MQYFKRSDLDILQMQKYLGYHQWLGRMVIWKKKGKRTRTKLAYLIRSAVKEKKVWGWAIYRKATDPEPVGIFLTLLLLTTTGNCEIR